MRGRGVKDDRDLGLSKRELWLSSTEGERSWIGDNLCVSQLSTKSHVIVQLNSGGKRMCNNQFGAGYAVRVILK